MIDFWRFWAIFVTKSGIFGGFWDTKWAKMDLFGPNFKKCPDSGGFWGPKMAKNGPF